MGEYPPQEVLDDISLFDFSTRPTSDFIELIERNWWMSESGFHVKGKRIIHLRLHTWGWSGNEDIIEAMMNHKTFWLMCWRKSIRGGHFWFRIDTKLMTWLTI